MATTPVPVTTVERSFPTGEGFSLAATARGNSGHPPVLFLHGGGQTRHSWGGAAAGLAGVGWYTVCLDQRGHGESGWSAAGKYQIEDFVDDLNRVSRAIGPRPVVVGASLGGIAALLAAGEGEPEAFRAVVLVDIAPRAEPAGVQRIRDFMRANPGGFASVEEAADAVATYRRHRARPKDVSGLHKNLRLKEDGRYYWHWDPRFLSFHSTPTPARVARLQAAAAAIRVPALLVRGAQSDVVSEEGVKDFLRLVPGSKFADVSGAGHMVAGDRNDAFAGAVGDFLNNLPR